MFFIVCKGQIELLHSEHGLSFSAADWQKQKQEYTKTCDRKERRKQLCIVNHNDQFQCKIKKKNIHGENVKYEFARVTGNCCWQIGQRFMGGQALDISTAKTEAPGWSEGIKRVILTECIAYDAEVSVGDKCGTYRARPPIQHNITALALSCEGVGCEYGTGIVKSYTEEPESKTPSGSKESATSRNKGQENSNNVAYIPVAEGLKTKNSLEDNNSHNSGNKRGLVIYMMFLFFTIPYPHFLCIY